MRVPTTTRLNLYTILTGLVGGYLLLSAVGKAWDMAGFLRTIATYGFARYQAVAPLLITLEIALGTALLLRAYVRPVAIITSILLVGLTSLFAYAYVTEGATTCGCLGALEVRETPAWMSFTRNLLLLLDCVYLVRHPAPEAPLTRRRAGRIALVASIAMFVLMGVAYARVASTPLVSVVPGQALVQTPLVRYATLSTDSTYLFFVFSPTCPHCWQQTPTVLQYQQLHVVDRIIALSPTSTKEQQRAYVQKFHPPFPLQILPKGGLYAITRRIPTAILVQHGRIVQVLGPHMPPPTYLHQALH